MGANLIHKVTTERFLPSEYPEELFFIDEMGASCELVCEDAPSDWVDQWCREHSSEYGVWIDPDLSADAKSLFTVVNSFKKFDEPLPKAGWFIDYLKFSASEFIAACSQLRDRGLIEAGDLA